MATDVIMPQMGESIFEGTITKWLKKPGERVERDEPLFEISTDKVDAEIPAPAAGVLKEIKVGEGQTVPIQTVVAVIDSAGAVVVTPPPKAVEEAKSGDKKAPHPAAQPVPAAPAKAAPAPMTAPARSEAGEVRSSPLVRRLAKEHGIDLLQVPGTGAGGRIGKKDIQAAIESGTGRGVRPVGPRPAGSSAAVHVAFESAVPRERIYFGHYQVQPMSVMRQKIAEHMVASKRVSPHVYSMDEIDMTRIAQLREKNKNAFELKFGTKLTFMPFFVRACVEGLRAFPTVNSSLDGTNVVLHREINIGMAVALDWGLIVPVIKNAEEMSFLGVARAINDLAERARTKKLKPEEVQEGTFSITNPGVFGGLVGLPVISQPNVAIMGLGTIKKRPVVIDDAIAIRSMVYITLSYDHRVVDGAVAHQFLGKVKGILENWSESVL